MIRKYNYLLLLTIVIIAFSCANRGIGPQGGPKDETPPQILKEEPANGSLNEHAKEINITFDEIVQLDNIAENLLISPPQKTQPTVKAYSKKVRVSFDDDLLDSTTYTIDFGNAIVDNNEKNPLRNYTFAFSTGDFIDTLQIAGRLLYAENLNPMSGIIVGIHSNLEDSALSSLQFDRVARTDTAGRFRIRNIRSNNYRLYAIADSNKDYQYQLGEGIAWHDSIVTPRCHNGMLRDTVWFDDEIIDSIRHYQGIIYEPSNITMLLSEEDLQRHYFTRAYRDKQHFFQLVFSAPQDSAPQIRAIGKDTTWINHSLPQYNETLDTITYWLTDSLAINIDTIEIELTYQKSDSIFQLYTQTDTTRAIFRHPRQNNKAKKKATTVQRVEYKDNSKSKFDIFQPLTLTFATPLTEITADSLHLNMKVDTAFKPLPLNLIPKDSTHMVFYVMPQGKELPQKNDLTQIWESSEEYQLKIDSGALHDIYGNTVTKKTLSFKTASMDDYSSIKIILAQYDSTAIIQLLDNKDQVVRSLPAQPEGTEFKYLKPQDYYMRLYLDMNGDQKWTPAWWQQKRQPEPVYYFPNKLTLRANWDFEETWNHLDYINQKPAELSKDQSKNKKK